MKKMKLMSIFLFFLINVQVILGQVHFNSKSNVETFIIPNNVDTILMCRDTFQIYFHSYSFVAAPDAKIKIEVHRPSLKEQLDNNLFNFNTSEGVYFEAKTLVGIKAFYKRKPVSFRRGKVIGMYGFKHSIDPKLMMFNNATTQWEAAYNTDSLSRKINSHRLQWVIANDERYKLQTEFREIDGEVYQINTAEYWFEDYETYDTINVKNGQLKGCGCSVGRQLGWYTLGSPLNFDSRNSTLVNINLSYNTDHEVYVELSNYALITKVEASPKGFYKALELPQNAQGVVIIWSKSKNKILETRPLPGFNNRKEVTVAL